MEPGGSQSPQIHNAFVKTAKKVIVLSIYYCQIKSRTDGYLEEEGKGSEDRPFSRTPERLPHKRKVAQKEKSPADLAAGGDIKNGKAELSSQKQEPSEAAGPA